MPRLIHLNGPSRVGKSTLARRYGDEHPGTLVLDLDVLAGLVGGWKEDFSAALDVARDHGRELAARHLRGGNDVILPQLVTVHDRDPDAGLEDVARGTGATYVEVALVVDDHEHRRRLSAKHPDNEVEQRIQAALLDPGSDLVDRICAHLDEYLASRPHTIRIDTTGLDEDASYARLVGALEPASMSSGDAPRVVDDRVPLGRTPEEHAAEDAFMALYGEWAPMTPPELAEQMRGFDRPWWIVGGWAIEAATGFRREHEDTDMSILSCDVPAFVDFMKGRWHVWNNVGGVLHPLGERWSDVDEPRSQLWLRASAKDPWVVDIPLTPDVDGLWTNKFVTGHTAAVEDVTWLAEDGIRYLLPEIVLVYKARLGRPKDEPDFAATLPTLTGDRLDWMREALTTAAPEHPWIERLRPPGSAEILT